MKKARIPRVSAIKVTTLLHFRCFRPALEQNSFNFKLLVEAAFWRKKKCQAKRLKKRDNKSFWPPLIRCVLLSSIHFVVVGDFFACIGWLRLPLHNKMKPKYRCFCHVFRRTRNILPSRCLYPHHVASAAAAAAQTGRRQVIDLGVLRHNTSTYFRSTCPSCSRHAANAGNKQTNNRKIANQIYIANIFKQLLFGSNDASLLWLWHCENKTNCTRIKHSTCNLQFYFGWVFIFFFFCCVLVSTLVGPLDRAEKQILTDERTRNRRKRESLSRQFGGFNRK